jgi:hypothetical protein
MSKFDIAWPRKHLEWRRREVWKVEAVLLERRLLNGKPSMQIICTLASISEDEAHADGAIEARHNVPSVPHVSGAHGAHLPWGHVPYVLQCGVPLGLEKRQNEVNGHGRGRLT